MDNYVYEALMRYFSTLGKIGYLPFKEAKKLLILSFYNEFIFNDYRGYIAQKDYELIERALNCLFGTSCLMPYPDYMKNGRLHIGEMSEVLERLKNLEETPVLKVMLNEPVAGSDIIVMEEEEE